MIIGNKFARQLDTSLVERRTFLKSAGRLAAAALGFGIAQTTKAEGDGKLPPRPLTPSDRLRQERDSRIEEMRQSGFSPEEIQRARNAYAEDIANEESRRRDSDIGPELILGVVAGVAAGVAAVEKVVRQEKYE